MNCPEALERLLESLDGTLAAEDQRRLGAHLARCPACAERGEDHRRTDRLLGRWTVDPLPSHRLDHMTDAVLERGRRRPILRPARRWRWAAAAAALLIGTFAAVRLVPTRSPAPDAVDSTAQALLSDPELAGDFDVILELADLEEMGEVLDLDGEDVFLFSVLADL